MKDKPGGELKDKHKGWKRHKKDVIDFGDWIWGGVETGTQYVCDGVKSGGQYIYDHPVETLVVVGGVIVLLDPVPGDEFVYFIIVGGGKAIAR